MSTNHHTQNLRSQFKLRGLQLNGWARRLGFTPLPVASIEEEKAPAAHPPAAGKSIVKKRLAVLRGLIALYLLKALYPKALARVQSVAILLLLQPPTHAPGAPLAGSDPSRLRLLDIHPAHPSPHGVPVGSSIGYGSAQVRWIKPSLEDRPGSCECSQKSHGNAGGQL